MFDVTTSEFLFIAVVVLIAVGPKRVAETSRQIGRWVGRLRAEATRFKQGIQQEINTATAPAKESGTEVKEAHDDLKQTAQGAQADLAEGLRAIRDSVEELKGILPSPRPRPLRRRRF
jgi:sec-independent protein translocase protein TatB